MLDIMDMAVLDFLMGNMDRHHYETLKVLKIVYIFKAALALARSILGISVVLLSPVHRKIASNH